MRIGLRRETAVGARGVRVRPLLLLLVMAGFLLIVAVTASGQVYLTTTDESTTLLNSAVGGDTAAIRSFVAMNLQPADVAPGPLPADRATALSEGISALTGDDILAAALLRPDGSVIASSVASAAGSAPVTPGLTKALADKQVQAEMLAATDSQPLGPLTKPTVIREYLPIIGSGTVRAIAEVWRDATPILSQLNAIRIHTLLVILGGAFASVGLVYIVLRGAQSRMTRQTYDLLDAARRDPLTGTLNHGALVEALAHRIEAARADLAAGTVGVALLDIDNFRLLNETYGHDAGDTALRTLAGLLGAQLPDGADIGRYGPDEFLVTVATDGIAGLERSIERIRDALVDVSLRFEVSERLPLTISGGIATFPVNGESVAVLLATVGRTLDEARASGGDRIRTADASLPADEAIRFDTLEGLVIAVDTKDHYTARHSEDVAQYADFIAARLGLDDSFRQVLRRAGRLHDIGKIGIPDGVLRKPGKLTAEEYEVVKQHVALGDQIVRDLPDIELIRAGIRHHHERWDGQGYLTRLAGEEIPLVARILAVADAFSAMTTTRPYRKSLSVDEAITRLEDAAGSQLDEELVVAFVNGLRTAADPPLPGHTRSRTTAGLWTPGGSVDTQVA